MPESSASRSSTSLSLLRVVSCMANHLRAEGERALRSGEALRHVAWQTATTAPQPSGGGHREP